jgi:hypothetical protein
MCGTLLQDILWQQLVTICLGVWYYKMLQLSRFRPLHLLVRLIAAEHANVRRRVPHYHYP